VKSFTQANRKLRELAKRQGHYRWRPE
jgi:hypothetical protein